MPLPTKALLLLDLLPQVLLPPLGVRVKLLEPVRLGHLLLHLLLVRGEGGFATLRGGAQVGGELGLEGQLFLDLGVLLEHLLDALPLDLVMISV